MTVRVLPVLIMMWTAGPAGAAEDLAVKYEFGDRADIRIVTDVVATQRGARQWRHKLAAGSRAADARAIDRTTGQPLTARVDGTELVVDFGRELPADAEQRIGIEEVAYAVPSGGSVRVRLYQEASDREGYQLAKDGELRWKRFLGRLRTRAVLPTGWLLTSVDQPAVISRDQQGRVVLDFTQTGADSPSLFLTARKTGGGS